MELFFFTVTSILSASIVLSVIINTYVLSKIKKTFSAYAYIVLHFFIILWMIFRLAELFAPTNDKVVNCMMVQRVSILMFMPLWLALCLKILQTAWIEKKFLKMLTALSASFLTFLLYIVCLKLKFSLYYYIAPSAIFIAAAFLPLIYLNSQIINKADLSLKSIMRNIGDSIIILDNKNIIMDINMAFFEPLLGETLPQTYSQFIASLTPYVNTSSTSTLDISDPSKITENEIEFSIDHDSLKGHYLAKGTALHNKHNVRIGTIITFHDITEYKKLLLELDSKKNELISINDKLKDYLLVVNELEEAREKKEIIFKLQNSIGHEIMELLSILEVTRIKAGNDSSSSIYELEHAITSCRNIIKKIRISVSIIAESSINK